MEPWGIKIVMVEMKDVEIPESMQRAMAREAEAIGLPVVLKGISSQVTHRAKAGLVAMSKSLAQEVGSRGITVNVVAPGFVVTPMTDALNDAQKAKIGEQIPLGRLGQPEDIAGAVVYLASDAAAWVTGATLHVNGGMAML